MKTWRWGIAAGVFAAVAALGVASCGDDNEAAAPPQVASDPLTLDIQSATVPEFATTARPTVTFRVLDGSGNPIDLEAELATTATFPNFSSPGRAPAFTLAMLDDNNDYVSYYSTTTNPKNYTYSPDPDVLGSTITEADVKARFAPAPRTQAQAITVARGPNLTSVGTRVYRFTFPAPTTPLDGFDRTKSHKVAGWTVRRPNAADTDVASASLNFVPAGGTAKSLETVNDGSSSCGRCHGFVQAHGSRRGVQFCITCHSPQTGDPETNQTVNFKVMIHRIHSGETLPSVRQGIPNFIVGFRQTVVDWSDLTFPWHDHGVRHCTVCHSGSKDADNWKSKPTLAVCTSCHDNVKFTANASLDPCPISTAGGQGTLGFFKDCTHFIGPINVTDPNSTKDCIGCHGPGAVNAVERYHHGD
ncbi:MAG TPA: hypothetical protein VF912_04590 [Anaeromyxobacter sp.]